MAEDLIEIGSDRLSAAINPLGAELTHLRDAEGHELMTDADPTYWAGHAPILFPIVGRLNGDTLRLDGRDYAMKQTASRAMKCSTSPRTPPQARRSV